MYTPNDGDNWLIAKLNVQLTDFGYSQIVEHLSKVLMLPKVSQPADWLFSCLSAFILFIRFYFMNCGRSKRVVVDSPNLIN